MRCCAYTVSASSGWVSKGVRARAAWNRALREPDRGRQHSGGELAAIVGPSPDCAHLPEESFDDLGIGVGERASTHVKRTIAREAARVSKNARRQRQLERGENRIPNGPGLDFSSGKGRPSFDG